MKTQKSSAPKSDVRRRHRLMSDDGVRAGLGSVNEIFSLIEKRLVEDAPTLAALGIALTDTDKFLRCLSNREFGCQIELTGFLRYSQNHLINFRLEIILFGKKPARQKDSLEARFISGLSLAADFTSGSQLIWRTDKPAARNLTPRGVCELMFDLLINRAGKGNDVIDSLNDV